MDSAVSHKARSPEENCSFDDARSMMKNHLDQHPGLQLPLPAMLHVQSHFLALVAGSVCWTVAGSVAALCMIQAHEMRYFDPSRSEAGGREGGGQTKSSPKSPSLICCLACAPQSFRFIIPKPQARPDAKLKGRVQIRLVWRFLARVCPPLAQDTKSVQALESLPATKLCSVLALWAWLDRRYTRWLTCPHLSVSLSLSLCGFCGMCLVCLFLSLSPLPFTPNPTP